MTNPRRVAGAGIVVLLAMLLAYPLHRRYLYPEQDVPIGAAMAEFARGGIQPLLVVYPSALTNLLRLGDEALFAIGKRAGWWQERAELVAAWAREPWRLRFRLGARLVALAAGVVALVAVACAAAIVIPGWAALAAPIVLGTSLMFVREFHHGMYDAPAAAGGMVACALATRWLVRPSLRTLAGAAVAAAMAFGFKYNLGVIGLAVAAAVVVAPSGVSRVRAGVVATVSAIVTLVLVMPVVVLDPGRLIQDLAAWAPRQLDILREHAPPARHGVGAALALGFGTLASAVAAGGFVVAVFRRERLLAPLAVFAIAYVLVLAGTPIVLNRYAVPLAPPLAVFAAYGIAALPRALGTAVTVLIVSLALPSSLAHVRLLAVEDTRVIAARWIEKHARDGSPVFLAGNAATVIYSGPDVAPIGRPGVPDTHIRYFAPPPGESTDVRRLAAHSGGIVVTSEHPSTLFARVSTPPEHIALLERHARLVLDLPIEDAPDPTRVFEPFDLNYVPFSGLSTLARPGPHLRIWAIPRAGVSRVE